MGDSPSIVVSEIVRTGAGLPLDRIDTLVAAVTRHQRIYLHAVGRCGLVVRCFVIRLAQLGFDVSFVGDITTTAVAPDDALIVASGSGRTGTAVLIAEQGKARGLPLTAITASDTSPLARLADTTITLPGVPKDASFDPSVSRQPPGSLFEQMLFCFLEETVVRLTSAMDPRFETIERRHANLE